MPPEYSTDIEITTDGNGSQIAAIFFAVIICASIAYAFGFGKNTHNKPISNELTVASTTATIQKIDPFSLLDIKARSAFVFDIKKNHVLYAKDAETTLPLASITKIMTAIVASESLPATSTISISTTDLSQDGDSGLLANERWNFKKLLDFTLSVSSNDGASAIASASSPIFIEKMNQKAATLGLNSMRFYNPTGLDESIVQSGGYGSAIDVAKLFSYTLSTYPDIFTATRYANFTVSSLDNFKHTAVNTDAEINNIPGIIGSKTGYSDLAGGNLAIIYDASVNYPIIVVVLGSTYYDRFDDILKLVKASNQALSLQK